MRGGGGGSGHRIRLIIWSSDEIYPEKDTHTDFTQKFRSFTDVQCTFMSFLGLYLW